MQNREQHQNIHALNVVTEPASERVTWDDVIQCLGQRTRGARKTWIVQTRIDDKTRKRTLGSASEITVSHARELAVNILSELNSGTSIEDPNPRLDVFAKQFLDECAGQWKPSTVRSNSIAIKNKILPAFGSMKLAHINRSDVVTWHRDFDGAPASANRCLAVLSSLFRHAELLGLRAPGTNPAQGLRRRQTGFKANYLDASGWQRLSSALRGIETDEPVFVAFIRFLCLTGCRRGEAQKLKWSMINGPSAILPDSKTGPRSIWLGKPTKKLLRKLPRYGDYVFASSDGRHISIYKIEKLWPVLRQAAHLDNLRIHDLRHSFASLAINNGIELRSIGGLLGHSDINTTAGYAHLDKKAEQGASLRVARKFETLMSKPTLSTEGRFPAFIRSKQSVDVFCAQRGYEPKVFLRELRAWRKAQKGSSV